MLEDLTIDITEHQNGVRLIYHYRLESMGSSGFRHSAFSIIGRLNKAFIRLGYRLNIGGKTSSISTISGKEITLNGDSESHST